MQKNKIKKSMKNKTKKKYEEKNHNFCYEKKKETQFAPKKSAPIFMDTFSSDFSSNPSAPKLQESMINSFDEFSQNEEMEMGIGSGGKMKQKIYKDKYGHDFWNESKIGRIFVHIVNSTMYEKITGKKTPSTPIDVQSYKSYQYPWYDIYDENKSSIKKSNILQNVKTVKEVDQQKYMWPQEDNSTVFINGQQVITLKPKVKDTIRDGNW